MTTYDSYCDRAQYIDEQFICWYTGLPCDKSPADMFKCRKYDIEKKKEIRKIYKDIADRRG